MLCGVFPTSRFFKLSSTWTLPMALHEVILSQLVFAFFFTWHEILNVMFKCKLGKISFARNKTFYPNVKKKSAWLNTIWSWSGVIFLPLSVALHVALTIHTSHSVIIPAFFCASKLSWLVCYFRVSHLLFFMRGMKLSPFAVFSYNFF